MTITEVLCWFNDNSGFLTFLTVFASLITCIFSLISAKAAWAQVRELRRQFEEENRPNIEVEFLYSRRTFYVLRFVNHGKCTAQNVRIMLDPTFIAALPEPTFADLLHKQEGKSCVIGAGQHYDLFFGANAYRSCSLKPPAKGKVLYQANGTDYESEFYIDMESYGAIFSVNSDQDDLMEKLKAQNNELNGIKIALQNLNLHIGEEGKDV